MDKYREKTVIFPVRRSSFLISQSSSSDIILMNRMAVGGDVLLGPWNPYPIPELVK